MQHLSLKTPLVDVPKSHSKAYVNELSREAAHAKKVQEIMLRLTPLVPPYRDKLGNLIRIWNFGGNNLIGGVLDGQNVLTVIPGEKIRNALIPDEKEGILLSRFNKPSSGKWDLVFDRQKKMITIWPHLEAAGRYDQVTVQNAIQKMIRNMFHFKQCNMC